MASDGKESNGSPAGSSGDLSVDVLQQRAPLARVPHDKLKTALATLADKFITTVEGLQALDENRLEKWLGDPLGPLVYAAFCQPSPVVETGTLHIRSLWTALRDMDIPTEQQDENKNSSSNQKRRRLDDGVGVDKATVKLLAPPNGCKWIFGTTHDDRLFLRDEEVETWTLIRKEFDRVKAMWNQQGRDGLMTFIWCGTPGIGKSWCINNYILWQLSKMKVDVVLELSKHKLLYVLKANGDVRSVGFGQTPPELRDEPNVWHVFDPATDGSSQPVSRTVGVTLVTSSPNEGNFKSVWKDALFTDRRELYVWSFADIREAYFGSYGQSDAPVGSASLVGGALQSDGRGAKRKEAGDAVTSGAVASNMVDVDVKAGDSVGVGMTVKLHCAHCLGEEGPFVKGLFKGVDCCDIWFHEVCWLSYFRGSCRICPAPTCNQEVDSYQRLDSANSVRLPEFGANEMKLKEVFDRLGGSVRLVFQAMSSEDPVAHAEKLIKDTLVEDLSRFEVLFSSSQDAKTDQGKIPHRIFHGFCPDGDDAHKLVSLGFCSTFAARAFFAAKGVQDEHALLKFMKKVIQRASGSRGIGYEVYSHWLFSQRCERKFDYTVYESQAERKSIDMGAKFQLHVSDRPLDAVSTLVKEKKRGGVEPGSESYDAVDLFLVVKDGTTTTVLAVQDTIGSSHSFHPQVIQGYERAIRKAAGVPFEFHYCIVHPTPSTFRFQQESVVLQYDSHERQGKDRRRIASKAEKALALQAKKDIIKQGVWMFSFV